MGLFIYFSGNFFVTIFIAKTQDAELKSQMVLIYKVTLILKNVILSLALLGNNFESEEEEKDEFKLPDDVILDEFKLTNLNKS